MPKHLAYGFDGNALFQGDERSEGVSGGVCGEGQRDTGPQSEGFQVVCVVIGKDSPALSEIAFKQDK